jgi:acetoin utilization deacetylase AcuC-like enzyme
MLYFRARQCPRIVYVFSHFCIAFIHNIIRVVSYIDIDIHYGDAVARAFEGNDDVAYVNISCLSTMYF